VIRISITIAAFEAISATLPLGSVMYEPQRTADDASGVHRSRCSAIRELALVPAPERRVSACRRAPRDDKPVAFVPLDDALGDDVRSPRPPGLWRAANRRCPPKRQGGQWRPFLAWVASYPLPNWLRARLYGLP
jgi:hypothetical protein